MAEYPVFKNGIAYIDHSFEVTPEIASWWKEDGIKKIVTLTHGTDHIHTNLLPVENRPGINTDSTAQWCIWKMLEWAYQQEPPTELVGKEALIIGHGKIGLRIQDLLWMHSIATDIRYCNSKDAFNNQLKKGIPKADIIFLCIPPERNEGFWNVEKMGWMKKSAILITPSRPIVFSQEIDLFKEKRIIWDKKHEAWRTDASIKRKKEAIQ